MNMETKKILIAVTDKDEAIRINNFLEERGFAPHIVTDSQSLMSKIKSRDFDMLLLDMEIVEESELSLVKFIKERHPSLRVIISSPKEKLEKSIDFARKFGFMYVTKPVSLNELQYIIDTSAAAAKHEASLKATDDYFRDRFIGRSEVVKKIIAKVHKIARNESNILVTGETGTGKELIARAIYELSPRAQAPFIAVNCAAIPENLLESELFGYKKGGFTGAAADKKGLIEMADNGTLFLDEIGDLSLGLQSKLLRVLEYGEFRRVGDEEMRRVNIRVIAATNQDLPELITQKKFREDLFFRLNVIHIHIPPLRERKEDIPLLMRFFVERYDKLQSRNIISIDAKARAILMQYDYPGNVRELDNIIQHAFAMSEGDVITADDLPVHLQDISPFYRLDAHEDKGSKTGKWADRDLLLSEVERMTILKAFDRHGSNHTKVAKALGVSRSTLWRKMKEYKINI
jgi:DNA-binding NtrC family response regulator